jgi:hypothetical protein
VICLNVLKHLADDLACLGNIHSTLQPGGRAIILVPEGQKLIGQIDVVLGHRRRYSREQLRARMQEAGFSVEQILTSIASRARPGFWRRADRFIPWKPTSIIAIAKVGQALSPANNGYRATATPTKESAQP